MLRLFRRKMFSTFVRCLVEVKIMVNGNHFQFDCKSILNFWKTIYGLLFSWFKLFILAHTFVGIHYHRALKWLPDSVLRHWFFRISQTPKNNFRKIIIIIFWKIFFRWKYFESKQTYQYIYMFCKLLKYQLFKQIFMFGPLYKHIFQNKL